MNWLLLAHLAAAHTFRPATLDLHQLDATRWSVHWTGSAPLSLHLQGCEHEAGAPIARCPDGPPTVEVRGILPTGQVLVGIEHVGRTDHQVLTADRPSLALDAPGGRGAVGVVADYVVIGAEHIWEGLDHLLFVLGLSGIVLLPRRETIVLKRRLWTLLKTLTGFTVGHSLTLSAAALGWVALASAPVEAVIALSIVLLARELLVDEDSLVTRAPWVVATGFGLVHGLGFAGALAELGLPEDGRLMGLLGFNLGVEIGQIGFVLLLLGIAWVPRALSLHLPPLRVRQGLALGLGTLASAWTLDRILGFFS